MKNNETLRVAVAETSVIVRVGLAAALRRLPGLKVLPVEVLSAGALAGCMDTRQPDVLIVNPLFCGYFDIDKFRAAHTGRRIRIVALVTSFVDESLLAKYDTSVSIHDTLEALSDKLHRLMDPDGTDEATENLSQREKEVLVCLVKGLSNKEIADRLCISIHTVITHRRNVCRKLQIHSVAGLTIYAIVNKLVTIDDVRDL